MARCTAPVLGHRSASAAAACPACGGQSRGYRSYSSYYSPSYSTPGGSGGGPSVSGGSSSSARPRWSRAGSSVVYTPAQVRALTPVRDSVEKRTPLPDSRDVFLCHAWDDRGGADKELSALLARDLLVPIVHNTTYEALRDVSPLLGSRSGLSTAEDTMASVAAKLEELVAL